MTQQTLELALDILSQQFLEHPTQENGDLLVKEISRLIREHKNILIDVIDTGKETQPSGYMGPDGKFYIHIFSSQERFAMSTATNPAIVDIAQLYTLFHTNPMIGGFSLNHIRNQGTIRITQDELNNILKGN